MNEEGNSKTTLKKFIDISEASKICSLHPHTIRRYADEGKIKCYKTPGGKRKFDRESLEKYCNPSSFVEEVPKTDRINYLYARVSSKKQLDDLARQIDFIRGKRQEYDSYTTLSDVASGINFKRKGLETILDACLQRTIGELVIAHRDRLCRFGYELLKLLVDKSGGTIIVLDDERNKSTEQELSEDLLSIIHIYSCKQMGKRSYRNKQLLKITESQVEAETTPEESTG